MYTKIDIVIDSLKNQMELSYAIYTIKTVNAIIAIVIHCKL